MHAPQHERRHRRVAFEAFQRVADLGVREDLGEIEERAQHVEGDARREISRARAGTMIGRRCRSAYLFTGSGLGPAGHGLLHEALELA